MCGRFTQHHNTAELAERFGIQQVLFDPEPRYNIAPTQEVPIVREHKGADGNSERILETFRWGLIPSWAKDTSIGAKMINARSETAVEKPSFRNALKYRRCILPADGFFEWDKAGGTRQPFLFSRTDGEAFGFAGLWEEWNAPDGSPRRTWTILTTSANDTVGKAHDRRPVILRTKDDEAEWLDNRIRDAADLLPLFVPYPDAWMTARPVSKLVNNPVNDVPDVLASPE